MTGGTYERENMPLIVYVPDNTVHLKLNVTAMGDTGELIELESKMSISELYQARIDGE